jgi:hypothetical protein
MPSHTFNECDINKIVITNGNINKNKNSFNKCKIDKIEVQVKDNKRKRIKLTPEQIESISKIDTKNFMKF